MILKECLNLLDEWECNFDYKIINIPIKSILELSMFVKKCLLCYEQNWRLSGYYA